MKSGETIISPKDNSPEILVLQGDGNLYGNRTHHNYGKMAEENKKEKEEEKSDSSETDKEGSSEEEESEDKEEKEENK